MARLPFWTLIGRRLRRMWRVRFRRVLAASTRRSSKKNRHRRLGEHKRFSIKSRSSIWGPKKRRRYRRRGPNYAFVELFVASVLCAFVFPLDLISSAARWRPKKKRGTSSRNRGTSQKSNTAKASSSNHKNRQTEHSASKNFTAEPSVSGGSQSARTPKVKKETHTSGYTVPKTQQSEKSNEGASTVNFNYTSYEYHPPKEEPVETVLDENTPKSKPKHEGDQYIRKRMIIAGSYYCDKAVLEQLQVGIYFDVSPEPGNSHDKDAVMLTYHGEKIGYISKTDKTPFVVCLKLKRNIYGVITDIIVENGKTKYEFETWFDQHRGDLR